MSGIHRCFPQLVGVHLSKAFETLNVDLATLVIKLESLQLIIVLDPRCLCTDLCRVQRWLSDVDVTVLDHVDHLPEEEGGSVLHISHDCGETWEPLRLVIDYHIDDMAWIDRDGLPSLLWATDNGLYEHTLAPGAVPQKILFSSGEQDMGFYAVAVSLSAVSGTYVAVAARQRGVFISSQDGKAGTFSNIGLETELIPVLEVPKNRFASWPVCAD